LGKAAFLFGKISFSVKRPRLDGKKALTE